MIVGDLVIELESQGVHFETQGDRLRVDAPVGILSPELRRRLTDHKWELITYLEQRVPFEPWMLWEWRRVSMPVWRRILCKSIERDDRKREEYARWMLREVLLDPEYREPDP